MKKDYRILAIHTGGIGDIIMATPALKAIRHVFPNAKIHFLGNPKSVEIIQYFSYIDEIIKIDTVEIKRNLFSKIFKMFKFVLFLRNQKYDFLFVLQPQLSFMASVRMGLFTLLLGIPERFGRDTNGRGFFLTNTVAETNASKRHEVERMLDVVRLSGPVPESYKLEIPISQEDRKIISDFLKNNCLSKSRFLIAIAPGFGKPTRKWYPERWAKLSDQLVISYGAKIIMIGGLKEFELFAQISNLMKEKPIIVAGKTTVPQTVALFELCSLVITNDSGPMHLAAAARTNIIALFGPGDYNRIRPYGDANKFVIVRKEVNCAPCYKVECEDHRCMKDITVDDVFKAVEKFL